MTQVVPNRITVGLLTITVTPVNPDTGIWEGVATLFDGTAFLQRHVVSTSTQAATAVFMTKVAEECHRIGTALLARAATVSEEPVTTEIETPAVVPVAIPPVEEQPTVQSTGLSDMSDDPAVAEVLDLLDEVEALGIPAADDFCESVRESVESIASQTYELTQRQRNALEGWSRGLQRWL